VPLEIKHACTAATFKRLRTQARDDLNHRFENHPATSGKNTRTKHAYDVDEDDLTFFERSWYDHEEQDNKYPK
jgi:hypothetical protein